MKFTLTYEGSLQTGGRKAARKHDRRKFFHCQLKRLWMVHSPLASWHLPVNKFEARPALDVIKQKYYSLDSFNFIPLITRDLSLEAALHFRILRSTIYKGQIADPDNVVKILVDSLKMPQAKDEIPTDAIPAEDEVPFFVLMEDDGLLSRITSATDELLQPVNGKSDVDRNDIRVMIDVYIRPVFPKTENLIFFSDDFDIWDHRWASSMDGCRGWSNSELKARTTQCILRMRITASNFRMQRASSRYTSQCQDFTRDQQEEAWRDENARYAAQSDEHHVIWNSGLRPIAMALKNELERRVYGEQPYQRSNSSMHAIEIGMLAGPDPIQDAAIGLESLMRLLP